MFARLQASYLRVLVLTGLIAATSFLAVEAQSPYEKGPKSVFVTFDAPGAGTGSLQGTGATAIDAAGDVAGGYLDAAGVEHAFFRSAKGVITTFDAPGSGSKENSSVTVPIAFDAAGDLMGISSDKNGMAHGFVRVASGMGIIQFDAPGAGGGSQQGTFPAAINAGGTIAGVYIDGNDVAHGFVRTATGTTTSFDAFTLSSQAGSDSEGTYVDSIDAAGDVAGVFIDAKTIAHGFIRSAAGTITVIDAPLASRTTNRGSGVTAMDAAGDVTGGYVDANDVAHGFVRTSKGVFASFDAPGAGTGRYMGTIPTGIDAAGDVVGMYVDASKVVYGFMRYASGVIATYSAPGANMSANALFGGGTGSRRAAGHAIKGARLVAPVKGGFANQAKSLWSKMGRMASGLGGLAAPNNLTNGSSGLIYGTTNLGSLGLTAINASGTVTGVYADGEAIGHGYTRSANGALTTFDAPGAGTAVYQGTGGLTINASGSIAGAYADANSVIHAFVLTVAQSATTTTLSTSQSSSVFGEPVTLTAKVASSGGAPPNGETVWFLSGSTALGTEPLSNGSATLTTTMLPGGTDALTAVYGGDLSFAGSTSKAITETIGKANSYTKLTVTPAASTFGQFVTLTAIVTGQFGGVPTGTATFFSGSKTLGTAPLSGGTAAFTTAALPSGTDAVTAQYSGDTNLGASKSGVASVPVSRAKPILSWPTPAPVPAGTVLGATQLDAIASVPGTLSYTPGSGTVLKAGTPSLSVTFTPADAVDYLGAQASVTLTVTAPASTKPTVTVTPSATAITTAQVLGVTVAVGGPAGVATPTGSVVLSSGSYASPAEALLGGRASIEVPAGALAVGKDTLAASYTPDATSATTYTVAQGISAAVTVTPQGITPGGTATTLAISSGGVPVASVKPGSVVTLAATVKAGSTAVPAGLVNFCDAAAAFCTDIHLLGTAQLSKAGTAAFKFRPGVGSHSYKAVFAGTSAYKGSASAASGLKVAGAAGSGMPATAAIAQGGNQGAYALTAAVGGPGTAPPTGLVSFLDSNNGNAVLGTAPLLASTAGLNWMHLQTPAVGYGTQFVAVGDFNGDGIPDLALLVPTYPNGTVKILLGNGDGSFAAGASLATGEGSTFIATGDFNGDGILDLAIANANYSSSSGSVTILMGKGDGTFTPAASSPVVLGVNPSSLAVGDFNRDGIADLAVASGRTNNVTILLGKGNGSFAPAANGPITVGSDPASIAVGDFNNDGIADLAVANSQSNTVSILIGKGDGSFTPAANSPVAAGYYPNSIAVGDFNGDGNADLAIANQWNATVTILMGAGNGSFSPAANSPVRAGSNPIRVAVGDFNGDGIPDLAVVDQGNGQLIVLLGSGNGTFTAANNSPVAVGNYPGALAVADFNGDGVPDLVVTTMNSQTETVLLTAPQSASAAVTGIAVAGLGPHQVVASYPGDSDYSAAVSTATPLYAPTPAPVFSLPSGTYTSVQTVAITDAVKGANIYYTTDGSTPGTWSTQYMGPIQITASETVQAIAKAAGYGPGASASASYTLNLIPAATPAISLPSGEYAGPQTVTITDATPEAEIYYTLNGSYPTTKSAKYAGPMIVSTAETLVAMAAGAGHAPSLTASAQYIIKSSPASMIYSVAGNGNQGFSGDGSAATAASLNYPTGTALDKAGNLYIADTNNNRIREVAAGTGAITTIAGAGIAGFSGDGALATSAQLDGPMALAVDGAGNLYVADSNNCAIRKIAAGTGVITTFAGNGTLGYLGWPTGVAFDKAGNLYIADPGFSVIFKIAANSSAMTVYAGQMFQSGYGGDNGPPANAVLNAPLGIAADSLGNLYIADTYNNRVRKVLAGGGEIVPYAGNGYAGYGGDGYSAVWAAINYPDAVAVDGAGNLYIGDDGNAVIRKVTASTGVITTIAGNGACCQASGDGGPASSADITDPEGLLSDSAGNLYIADSYDQRIRKVTAFSLPPTAPTALPKFLAAAGTYAGPQIVNITDATPGAALYITMDGTTPTAASTGYLGPIKVSGSVTIKAIAIAPGYLQSPVATATYTITSAPTPLITTVAGNGTNGFSGAGGAATSAELGTPFGAAFDGAGNLYVVDDGNNVVWKVAAKTGTITIVAGNGNLGAGGDGGPAIHAQLSNPTGIASDKAGNLYIADWGNNVIRKVTASTGLISTVAGNFKAGFGGDGGLAQAAQLKRPRSVALDSNGNLYIADESNNRVRKVDAQTQIITTVAGKGTSSSSGDGGPATKAGIYAPVCLAFDTNGNLYIASNAGFIRKVSEPSGIISTVAGNGIEGYSGDGGKATAAEILPRGLAVDTAGNLYISNLPAAVRKVTASTGIISTVAGTGIAGYSGDHGAAGVAEVGYPEGLSFDAAGNLYIPQQSGGTVRKVALVPAAAAKASAADQDNPK